MIYKCDSRGHTKDECWGPCTYCGKYNHKIERCFHKNAPKKESSERASKAQNKKKKQKKKKTKKPSDHERRETEEGESEDVPQST